VIDVFLDGGDESGSTPPPAWWSDCLEPGMPIGRVTFCGSGLDSGTAAALEGRQWDIDHGKSSIAACNRAITHAALARRPLLVVLQSLRVTSAVLEELRRCLTLDPMFGFSVPRIGSPDGKSVIVRPAGGVLESDWAPRAILSERPEHEILVEQRSACVLIAEGLVSDLGCLDEAFERLDAAVVMYMAMARRRGFRIVLANRAVAESTGDHAGVAGLAGPADSDRERLARILPDRERIWLQSRDFGAERFERILGAALRRSESPERFSVLLDLRNLAEIHNGTSQAALGAACALHRLCRGPEVQVLASPAARAFHRLDAVLPGWPIHASPVSGEFTCALRLSQPWQISEMIDLHHHALFSVFLMLDTIAWDIQYLGPPHLDGTWQFLADHADGFLFISEFTRQRFLARFENAKDTPSSVCHLSMDACDYVVGEPGRAESAEYLLVVGNELDHKDLAQSVDVLATAFPFQPLQVLGSSVSSTPVVTRHRSGSLSDNEVHRLYMGARAVIYPSFYEGFGFPIVTGLGHGLTVVARDSDLLDEVVAGCEPKGRLLTYRRRDELVDIVGALLHGDSLAERQVGRSFAADHRKNWDEVGRDILRFVEQVVAQPSGGRWRRRERVVQQLLASRG